MVAMWRPYGERSTLSPTPHQKRLARRYDREQLILHGPVALTNVNMGLIPENEAYKYTEKFRLVADEVLRLARGPKTEAYGETWKNTGCSVFT